MANATLVAIEGQFGEAARRYIENKHRGGTSGAKGKSYEDHFAAATVTRIAAAVARGTRTEWLQIQSQRVGFVDDMRTQDAANTSYFQLKNQQSVSWLAGEHPIAEDFRCQYELSCSQGDRSPTTTLVVSSQAVCNSLRAAMPSTISTHSSVEHFPWCKTVSQLVLSDSALKAELAELTANPVASDDEVAGLFAMFVNGLLEFEDQETSVLSVLELVAKQCPSLLRALPFEESGEDALLPDFVTALAQVLGLEYRVSRGFFRWSAFGTSGVFRQDCRSEEFDHFQSVIIENEPKSFEEFERFLP